MAIEESIEIKGDDNKEKSSEKDIAVKIRCLKLLDSSRLLDAKLAELSTTITSVSFYDANGLKYDFFKGWLA